MAYPQMSSSSVRSIVCPLHNVFQLWDVFLGTRDFAGFDEHQSESEENNTFLAVNFTA